jgi:hypothetical protein
LGVFHTDVERAKTQAKQLADDKKVQIQALGQLEKDLDSLSTIIAISGTTIGRGCSNACETVFDG